MSGTEAEIRDRLLYVVAGVAGAGPDVPRLLSDLGCDICTEGTTLEQTMQGVVGMVLAMEAAQARLKALHEAMRAALFTALTDSGAYLVETQHHAATVVDGARAVIVTEPGLLDERYWTMPKPAPDKDKIKRVLKAGGAVDGAMLSNGAPHLRISARKQEGHL